ncbi:MAG: serpin family protein [Cyclobacteriaceae bacterium]|nr:serpin family protein [Cyclobacteriaceae bacterium]
MKKLLVFATILISAALYQSCGNQIDCDCVPPPDLRPIRAEEEAIISSVNDFAFDIFKRVNESGAGDENLFISPLSISTALSMTANGAAGETNDGIRQTLHLTDVPESEINSAYKTLVPFLTELDPKVTLNLANSNWYKEELTIHDTFKQILLDYYDAEVFPADFKAPATKDEINDWIEGKTNGKIRDMLDQIPAEAVMYLINAIYLKATWQYQFDKSKTEKKPFYLANGSTVQTDMMFSKGAKIRHFGNSALQLIEIPYGNGQFVFSVIMPNNAQELDATITSLDMSKYEDYLAASDTMTLQLRMPKFKITYKSLLNEVLSDMGMALSFSDYADFSRLFEEPLELQITRVIHQSFIEVDEEGTEAAAATVVEIGLTSANPNPKPMDITLDKPFVFFIRERHSNTILFAGKLLDPTMTN